VRTAGQRKNTYKPTKMIALDQIRIATQIQQSTLFAESYHDTLDNGISTPINRPLFTNLRELHHNILASYSTINNYQRNIIAQLFTAFENIATSNDSKKIKDFSHYYNEEEGELLFYRKNNEGLINIIIEDEELFAFSYLDNNTKENNQLLFYREDEEADFEHVALMFFS
jgi:hypothetical protein